MLTQDEVVAILDEFMVRPNGIGSVEIGAIFDTEEPQLVLTAWSFNSRNDEYFDEYLPDELAAPLVVTGVLGEAEMEDEASLVRHVCQRIAEYAAHEALEWTRYRGAMPWNPHEQGEPIVHVTLSDLSPSR